METRVCTHWQHHQLNMLPNGPDNHNQLTFVALKPAQVPAISIIYIYNIVVGYQTAVHTQHSYVCPRSSPNMLGLYMLESRCNISAFDFFFLYRLLLPFQLLDDLHRSLEWRTVYE